MFNLSMLLKDIGVTLPVVVFNPYYAVYPV